MAYTVATRSLVDTATEAVVHVDGYATDGTEISATNIFDSSAATYGLATITLSAVSSATDKFCIGEIVTADSISMVVQDHTLGGNTLTVYRCTSSTDATPVGWSSFPGTTEAIVGSVSGTHTITTSGTVAGAHITKSVSVTGIKWSVSTGHSVHMYYNGGTADQDIGFFTGGGVWDSTNHFIPVTMGAAAGDGSNVMGDIQVVSFGAAADDSMTMQVTIKKGAGYGTPNYEKNATIGFAPYAAGTVTGGAGY